jgi:protein-tyrosine phosphatase
VIDLHCHVLPGIDDGPATLDETVALVRAAVAAGTQTIVATPHVSWHYANDSAGIAALVEVVNARLVAEGLALEVLGGAEIAMTRAADLSDAELGALSLGGGPWLLVECPFTAVVTGFEALLIALRDRGHPIILAHPERCPAFQREPQALMRLVEQGMLTSITAGSLVGRFGRDVRRFAAQLFEGGLVHNVASDAHDDSRRPPGMAAELEQAGLDPLTAWATEDVPAAILSGAAVPPRPVAAAAETGSPRRRWWLRR